MHKVPISRPFTAPVLLGMMLSLVCAVAWAEAGRVQVLLGKATVERGGKLSALRQGTPVESGDVLETAASSSVQLSMTNGERIDLRADTRFVIDAYVPPATRQDPGRSFYSLLRGGLRTVTNTLVRRSLESYRIQTPLATIGVRGTQFALLLQEDGLYARVDDGVISIGNQAGTLELPMGQFAHVKDATTLPALAPTVPPPLADEQAPAGSSAGAVAEDAARGTLFTPLRIGIGIAGALGLAAALSGGGGGDDGGGDGPPGTAASGAAGTTPAQ